jgi:hypothetical protein
MSNLKSYDSNILSNFYMSYVNFYHFLIIMFYLITGCSLIAYAYYKIDLALKKSNKKNVYIVRRLPFLKLDDNIRDIIKSSSGRNYRILSTYDLIEKNGEFDVRNLAKYSSIVLKSYIKTLSKGDHDIYILNRNQYKWEYIPYVLLAKKFNYEPIILEFVSPDMMKSLNDTKNNELEYKKSLEQIKKYEIDNKLCTKRISV